MKRFFSILITSIALTAVIKYEAQSLSCGFCGYNGPCEDPKCCESESYHPTVCLCCRVCAKRHNEYCGGLWNFGGSCDVGLSCVTQCTCKTEKGLDCIFPFKYNGTTYNACTDVGSANNKTWCATEVDGEGKVIDEQWDNCGPFCPTKDYPCDNFNLYDEGGRCLNKTETQIIKDRSGDLVIIEDGVSNVDPAPRCDTFEDICKCNDPPSLDIEFEWRNGEYCFVKNVQDPSNPKKNCYDDVRWSESNGQFWSKLAYKAFRTHNYWGWF